VNERNETLSNKGGVLKAFIKAVTILIVMLGSSAIVLAQFAKPEDAVTYRKSVMQVIKKHFGSMAAVVKGEMPFHKRAFGEDAKVVAMMSTLPWEASLVPGSTEGDTTLTEKALKESEKYLAAAKRFEKSSRELAAAAQSGEMASIKKRFGETAQTCSGCHKAYRK
jgi:cytochrome c556